MAMPRSEIGDAQQLLSELERWVKMETPTTEPARVNALMDVAEADLTQSGARLTRIPGREGYGDTLVARVNERSGVKPILVAGHLDTVWSWERLIPCRSGSMASAPMAPAFST
jgi:glutamate carboxypeptidase